MSDNYSLSILPQCQVAELVPGKILPHIPDHVYFASRCKHFVGLTQTCCVIHLQKPDYKLLAAIGVAAVGCTTVAAMSQTDANRFKALNLLTPSAPDFLEPLQIPADLDSQLLMQPPLPASGVPQANPALDMLSQDQLALEFERQRDRERSSAKPVSNRPLPTGAGRGRPRKEPKMILGRHIYS